MMGDTIGTGKCSLAKIHVPGQPNPDQHHTIPQAWQRFWQPIPPTVTSTTTGRPVAISNPLGILWAPATITVCPNHHRLIHQAIVAMMRTTGESPAESFKQAFGSMRLSSVRQAAYDALEGWVQVGGSLAALRAAKLWGEQ